MAKNKDDSGVNWGRWKGRSPKQIEHEVREGQGSGISRHQFLIYSVGIITGGLIGTFGGYIKGSLDTLEGINEHNKHVTLARLKFFEHLAKGKNLKDANHLAASEFKDQIEKTHLYTSPLDEIFSIRSIPDDQSNVFLSTAYGRVLLVHTAGFEDETPDSAPKFNIGVVGFRLPNDESASISDAIKDPKNYLGSYGYDDRSISHRMAINMPEVKTFLANIAERKR